MTAADEIRQALTGCAAIMRGTQSEVAHHTDFSPEIEAAESALARVAELSGENAKLRSALIDVRQECNTDADPCFQIADAALREVGRNDEDGILAELSMLETCFGAANDEGCSHKFCALVLRARARLSETAAEEDR